ncbi:hypothetical protein EXIGLDRAFT_765117 [Exidia glandulosa HHB12029]|uniref:Uncharacterized protein n=1 Tax=Exidia glandulosa HHB12029 TaxID=1314781 RepID=A0A165KR94_EXIGL|nr:hypothetical protein EXIGLDRAFT_765117 [Exidia glandulosa HHB12029]
MLVELLRNRVLEISPNRKDLMALHKNLASLDVFTVTVLGKAGDRCCRGLAKRSLTMHDHLRQSHT